MNKQKRIACFFTAGYTELFAMKNFLQKINNNVEFRQLCPISRRKNIKGIKDRKKNSKPVENGLTGDGLISYIEDFIKKESFKEEQYDAVLIEDDKDKRFLRALPDGCSEIDDMSWKTFQEQVTKDIHSVCPDIPVFFLFAAPEVEAWFIADWEKGFGEAYTDVFTTPQNRIFSYAFKEHIERNILGADYRDTIEDYGFIKGHYRKLSEEIQKSLDSVDFLAEMPEKNDHPMIRYRKTDEGSLMLENIRPECVSRKCTKIFRPGYLALKQFA